MNESDHECASPWAWIFMCLVLGFLGLCIGSHIGESRAEMDLVCNERHERWVLGLDKHDRETAWRSMGICREAKQWDKAKTFHNYLTGAEESK